MITNSVSILKKAKAGGYGVGAFNFKEYSDMRGIAEAAEVMNSPVILMSTSDVARFSGPRALVYAYRGVCEALGAPCVLHLDHARDLELIKECINAGYTSVMIDASEKPFNENIETTRRVVEMAREKGVSVEAELGTIGGKEDNVSANAIEFVDPETVAEFVEKTGVDSLAIAIGTVHGLYKVAPNLRFDLIEQAAARTGVPLVMHGGTGLTEDDFKRAVKCGISKVNVGTELKNAFTRILVETASKENALKTDPMNFLRPVREEIKKIVKGKIEIFGCGGKA